MNRYRWYTGTGYIEIVANSVEDARSKWSTNVHNSSLITMSDGGRSTFLCFSLPNEDPEVHSL
jgi:hypothetical protein